MTNLIVSRRCNQQCSYCFAGDSLASDRQRQDSTPDYISIPDFEQRLDFLDRSQIAQARFLGGEPTLHPHFAELVRRARARDKTIVVFSNGWMPKAAAAALEDLPASRCGVIVNITTMGGSAGRDGPAPASLQLRKSVLKRLGIKAQLGCNIHRPDQDLDFLTGLIIECGLKRAVRVGIAQPVLGGTNAFLLTKDYHKVGERLVQFAVRAAREGIKIELDCGFVRCMFSEEARAHLLELGADLGWRCNPIIDIDVDGRAYHCFPLAEKYWTDLGLEDTASDLREAFMRQTEPYRQAGIFKECSSCPYKIDQSCSGGCLSNTMRRFSNQPLRVHLDRSTAFHHTNRSSATSQ